MRFVLFLFLFSLAQTGIGQIINGSDTLYGNEWIDFSKTYYKIKVAADGIYQVPYATLQNAPDIASAPGSELRLYHNGEEVPMYVTTDGLFGGSDFVEFYGRKNRGELDRHLFEFPETQQVNPEYSMFNDTSAYYLVRQPEGGAPLRIVGVANDLSNPPAKEEWCWYEELKLNKDGAYKRERGTKVAFSIFDGDGFASGWGPMNNYTIPIKKQHPLPHTATVSARFTGYYPQDHVLHVLVNDSLYATESYYGWKLVQPEIQIPSIFLTANPKVTINGVFNATDFNVIAWISIRYARMLDFEGASSAVFEIDASLASKKYLEVNAFNVSSGAPVLYDVNNGFRLQTDVDNNIVKMVLPPSPETYQIRLAAYNVVTNLFQRKFHDYRENEDASYIILSNNALLSDPENNGENWVQKYADYRSSLEGGSYSVAIVEINELYEQFAWGQRFHPISVRNFAHYVKKEWTDPRFLLIVGKALNYPSFRSQNDQNIYADSLFFVPSYGFIGADMAFTMSGGGINRPLLATGRLAVKKPSQIKDYLEKVKEHEQQLQLAAQDIASRQWMKRVIHNGGGKPDEQASIKYYVNSLENVLESNRFGAEVSSFYKSSNDPLQLSGYEQMLELINGGVALWTIFGHSSANAIDFDIGTTDNYNNKGKYPFMLVNGCYTGQCSNISTSIGEQFVLSRDRGAIAYTAMVNNGFTNALYEFSDHYYKRLGGVDYGKSIGVQLQNTINDVVGSNDNSLLAAAHQFLLQGDPAVQLHSFNGPDYTPDAATFRVSPNPVNIDESTLDFKIEVANIGENTGGELTVRIDQRLPDNTLINRILDTVPAPGFQQKLQYTLPLTGSVVGFNRFLVTLDPANTIIENPAQAELNNTLLDGSGTEGVDVYFYADQVQALYPHPYGIIGKNKVTLSASALNTSTVERKYLFEMDTLESFDTPWKKDKAISQSGGLLTWEPDVILKDSLVYYWRVARDTLFNNALLWQTQSFVYLEGSEPGWNQSDFGQYRDGVFSNTQANETNREVEYIDNRGNLIVNVAYRNAPSPGAFPGFQNAYYEGNFGDYYWNTQCVSNEVLVVVADQNTGRFKKTEAKQVCGQTYSEPKYYNRFDTRTFLGRTGLMEFIEEDIADGDYVGLLAFSNVGDTLGYAPRLWWLDSITYGKNIFQVLEAQGAKEVRKTIQYNQYPHPYGLIFRKNHPDFQAIDTLAYYIDSLVDIRREFPAKWATGQFETPPIGAATEWKHLFWKRESFDASNEKLWLSVYGIRHDKTDTLLFKLTQTFDTTLSFVSSQQYPYLKLRYEGQDSTLRTLSQPQYLRVLYSSLPEGAMHPVAHEYFYADTLQQGDLMKASVAFRNVSDAPFDSLRVRYRIADGAGQPINKIEETLKPLAPGDTLHAEFSYDTRLMNGPYQYSVFMNYDTAQPELRLDNNIYVHNFFVALDNRNPLLDVTFDGMHILDGDLISPKPIINVSLKDDNPFLPLSDTTAFQLHVQLPDGSINPVYFSEVMFMPAEVSDLPHKNTAKLEWRPHFTQDGEYRLLVNGSDASGNASGDLDYTVTFKVINKSSISNLLNYPNPFSTSTCFVYTMTGAETPVRFKIQIMSVSGKVVKEITESEFGPMLPGTHRSDYCWNGRDNFGDQLANGVYLYRIVAKKADGSDFDFFENQTVDGYFKHGIGKMVLMR